MQTPEKSDQHHAKSDRLPSTLHLVVKFLCRGRRSRLGPRRNGYYETHPDSNPRPGYYRNSSYHLPIMPTQISDSRRSCGGNKTRLVCHYLIDTSIALATTTTRLGRGRSIHSTALTVTDK